MKFMLYCLIIVSSFINFSHAATELTFDKVKFDMDGDGKADILWRNESTGQTWLWAMNGHVTSQSKSIGTVSLDWDIAGRGDFNGDGKSDLLWRNNKSGRNIIWLMDGFNSISREEITKIADTHWQIKAVADFNGDGADDIFWRHDTTGRTYVWLMNSFTVSTAQESFTIADTHWNIAASGDINGDGKSDIIWRHSITGNNYIWQMDGVKPLNRYLLNTTDTSWIIAGVGDLDGDGSDDIIWRNKDDGRNWAYLMKNGQIKTSKMINTIADSNWQVETIADLDGDGKADIFWKNKNSGKTYIYLMNSTSVISAEYSSTISNAWQVINPISNISGSSINFFPIVNAGETQTVEGNSEVTLSGTATDSDGTISSYSWEQTSGTSVTLTNADSASTSFVAPDMTANETLSFTLTVVDNDGAFSSDAVNVNVNDQLPVISGKVSYERIPYWIGTIRDSEFGLDPEAKFLSPARLIVVNLNDVEGNLVKQTLTDESGQYHFELTDLTTNKSYSIEAVAQLELDGQINNGFYVETYESIAPMNVFKKETRSFHTDTFIYNGTSSNLDVNITAGWNEVEQIFDEELTYAQSFAVLDTILNAIRFFESIGFSFDNALEPLKVRWATEEMYDHKNPGEYISFFNTIDIGTPYSESTVIHEFTHFFEHAVLKRSDSKGGNHFPGDIINLPLAFSEGMAQAIPYAMLGDWVNISARNLAYDSRYYYEDFYEIAMVNYSPSAVTTTDKAGNEYSYPGYQVNPPYDELTVSYYLLSLLADRPDTERTINLYNEVGKIGFAEGLKAAAKSDAVMSLYSFSSELKALYPEQVNRLKALEEKLQFIADDKWGSTQTPFEQFVMYAYDNTTFPSEAYLPIYQELESSDTINSCFNGGFAGRNDYRPGTHRYIKFTAQAAGVYSITTQDMADKNGDTHSYRVEVKSAGQAIQTDLVSEDRYQFTAEAGTTYILYVIGENYFEGKYNINETICTDVSIIAE
jgi:hypothetical protein